MSAAEWLNTVVSGIVFVSAAVFVLIYHLNAPWRSTAMGRHLMAFGAAIGGLGAYTVAIAMVGPDGAPAATLRSVRAVLLLWIAGLLVQRTVMVIRAQRHVEKEEEEGEGQSA